MKSLALAFSSALLLTAPAQAAEAFGTSALSLASLVGAYQPGLSAAQKSALKGMGDSKMVKGAPFKVKADIVTCHSSNVDIAEHNCTLTFAGKDTQIVGRAAHELDATLREARVEGDAGAGNIYTRVSKLVCVVEPNTVAERGGGGAKCTWADAQ
jgi:hypothetical protein